jgi:hypothetical protein
MLARSMVDTTSVAEETPEGGYSARVVGESFFAQTKSVTELHDRIRDAVQCHFDPGTAPELIRLHFAGDE